MKLRYFFIIFSFLLPIVVLAQASGGQIRRSVQKQSNNKHTRSNSSLKTSNSSVPIEQNESTNITLAIQPITLDDLAKYNIVVASFGILNNAQRLCQRLRDEGWGAQIFLDTSNVYRVLMVGMSDESEALLYRDYARKNHPDAWIMCAVNGQAYKYE